jgi:hypothetical protein
MIIRTEGIKKPMFPTGYSILNVVIASGLSVFFEIKILNFWIRMLSLVLDLCCQQPVARPPSWSSSTPRSWSSPPYSSSSSSHSVGPQKSLSSLERMGQFYFVFWGTNIKLWVDARCVPFKGTVSPVKNGLKMVSLDRTWQGHQALAINKNF